MDIESTLKKIEYYDGRFPRAALLEIINNKELFTPCLIDIIKSATVDIDRLVIEENYMAHSYAIYLLAQFREKTAFPILIKFFSIPGETTLDVTGDLVTESLGSIIASLYDGDIELVKGLIENRDANEFVRSAAIESLLILVKIKERSREEILDYFKGLFNGGLEREYSYAWDALIDNSAYLYPEEVYDEIKKAYEDDLVNTSCISLEDVKDVLSQGKEKPLKLLERNEHFCLIDDIVNKMGNWAGFKEKKEEYTPIKDIKISYQNTEKIGRNEPCPCGSGKKYKKCCI